MQAVHPLMQTACHCHMALFQPAITVIVDWALQINYLSIYHGWLGITNQLSVYITVDRTLHM